MSSGVSSLRISPDQLSLVADDAAHPAGLAYWPEFVPNDTEQHLLGTIRGLPLQPFQSGAYEGKRRVARLSIAFHATAEHSA